MKILLIEDEEKLAKAIKYLLIKQNYDCDIANDGLLGYEKALNDKYNIILLDIMLPKMNGYEILKKLREDNINTPIIMLTAKDLLSDKVKGLDMGADDYLTKPFEFDELIARIRALTRRSNYAVTDEITFDNLILNVTSGNLKANNETISLNYKEKEILKILMLSPDSIVSKEVIINNVWGWDSDATDNNLEAYMSFIRKKLKFLNTDITIKNYQKYGYKLEKTYDKKIKD